MRWISKLFYNAMRQAIEKHQFDANDFWKTIQCDEATWYTDTPDNITSRCWYEIQYNPSKDSYRLNCGGDKPTQHSYYITMSKAVAKLNTDNIEVQSALESVKDIFNQKQ